MIEIYCFLSKEILLFIFRFRWHKICNIWSQTVILHVVTSLTIKRARMIRVLCIQRSVKDYNHPWLHKCNSRNTYTEILKVDSHTHTHIEVDISGTTVDSRTVPFVLKTTSINVSGHQKISWH